jgi:glycosyltransferase involved in cell wall biosynthesis
MNATPKLSVVVSNYNYGEYLYETVASLAAQSVKPEEIIIVDDCSRDHSRMVIERICKELPNVRPVLNTKNLGCNGSINVALEMAQGEYFCSIGADDPLRDATFFEKALGLCRANPDCAFCLGEHVIACETPNGVFLNPIRVNLAAAATCFSAEGAAAIYRSRQNLSVPTSPALWKRDALREVGGLRDDLKWAADWFAALVLISRSGLCYVPGIYQSIRYSPKSFAQAGQAEQKGFTELLTTVLETLERPEFADARGFFKIPSVLARFGFRILHLIAGDPRFHKYLSLELLRCAVLAENCAFNVDLAKFGANPPVDVISLVYKEVLQRYATVLAENAAELRRRGQIASAIVVCRKALGANPGHAEANDLLLALEEDGASCSKAMAVA